MYVFNCGFTAHMYMYHIIIMPCLQYGLCSTNICWIKVTVRNFDFFKLRMPIGVAEPFLKPDLENVRRFAQTKVGSGPVG